MALPAQAAEKGFALRDGVIVDAAGSTAYVMGPEGIEALDLATGGVLWTSTVASRPLALIDGMLVAQADGRPGGGLQVVMMDTKAQGAVHARGEVALPAGVHNRVDDAMGASLQVAAMPGEGAVEIAWKSLSTEVQAMLPGPQDGQAPTIDGAAALIAVPKAPRKALEGVARLDLAGGEARPASKNGRQAFATLTELRGEERLTNVDGRQFLAADGRHVLVSLRDTKATSFESLYRWTVIERATGATLGSFRHSASAAPFLVVGQQVIFEAQASLRASGDASAEWDSRPLSLRSVDLTNGAAMWTAALRKTTFDDKIPH